MLRRGVPLVAASLALLHLPGGCVPAVESSTPTDAASETSADAAPEDAPSDAAVVDASDSGACVLPQHWEAANSAICLACLHAHCCAPIAACEADTKCAALSKCINGCTLQPDAGGCYQGCQSANPNVPAWDTALDCVIGAPPLCGPDCSQ